jgi:hypothetical protein
MSTELKVDFPALTAWVGATDRACLTAKRAFEQVAEAGGEASAALIAEARQAVANLPPLPAALPAFYDSSVAQLAGAIEGLAQVGTPLAPMTNDGVPRMQRMALVECVIYMMAARSQAARMLTLALSGDLSRPAGAALMLWSIHWDACGYLHEGQARLVSGVDGPSGAPELIRAFGQVIDTFDQWLQRLESAYEQAVREVQGLSQGQPGVGAFVATYGETLAIERECAKLWRSLAQAPQIWGTQQGRMIHESLIQADKARMELQMHREQGAEALRQSIQAAGQT